MHRPSCFPISESFVRNVNFQNCSLFLSSEGKIRNENANGSDNEFEMPFVGSIVICVSIDVSMRERIGDRKIKRGEER